MADGDATHVVTVWLTVGGAPTRETFRASHVRSIPLGGGWHELVLMDEGWRVVAVEQFRQADRVSVRRVVAGEVE